MLLVGLSESSRSQNVRPDMVVISYNAYNKPLKQVLKDLSRISKVSFVYSESRIPSNRLVSINARKETLGSILKSILDGLGFEYKLVGNQIVIIKLDKKNPLPKDAIIHGYIKDKQSGEALIGAVVKSYDGSYGTVSNEYGFFSLKVTRETQRLNFDYIGYETYIKEFFVNSDSVLTVYLEPGNLLNEVVIIDKVTEDKNETTSAQHSIYRDRILASNHLGGEADLFRYLSTLPGVNTGADGTGGLNVRGGSADQNLVLLDGVPIYNIGHALGIFSIFNANTIKSVNFYNGGVPSRYAGRLSSVIDVYTKDGNYNKLTGDFSLSTIAATGTLEGPIQKGKSSFIVSYRRTFTDVWIKEFTRNLNKQLDRKGESNYFFGDISGKLNFKVGKTSRLMFTVLNSSDRFSKEVETLDETEKYDGNSQSLEWGNRLYTLRFTSQWSKTLFSKLSIYNSSYDIESFRKNRFELYRAQDSVFVYDASLFKSSIREYGIKKEWDWIPNDKNVIKFGIYGQRRTFSPQHIAVDQGINPTPDQDISLEEIKQLSESADLLGDEANAYFEDDIDLAPGIRMNVGLNYSLFLSRDKKGALVTDGNLQPRVALLANGENLHFKLGLSRMNQSLHLLTNDGLGLPTDIWVPTSSILPTQSSWIYSTSLGYKTEEGTTFGTELYYKIMRDISAFKQGPGFSIGANVDWEKQVPIGEGTAYGFEAYFDKPIGRNIFSINYTYSISEREYPDINSRVKYDFTYNRRHSFKFSYVSRLSNYSEFLINWGYMSGNAYTRPLNVTIDPNGKPVVLFDWKNNARFPDYHRLDLGFTFYNTYKWGRTKLFIGLFNAYNRKNPFYTELTRNTKENGKFVFSQYSLLPILPTVSYSTAF
jgi:hypothetical protein